MSDTLLSHHWYRVAGLRPRLRQQARLHRHLYRGQVWHLLQDPASQRVHRFSPTARLLIAAMDGRRTLDALWALAQRRLGEDAPTQDEVIELLGQLHAADLLQVDVAPDSSEVFERAERARRGNRARSRFNPMSLRFHLWNPDTFLQRIEPLTRVVWSRWGALLWLVAVVPALLLIPGHWAELTSNLADRVLALDNLPLLWIVFPLIKLAHELGHGIATKRGGGEVNDLGIMLLVLMPVPYVDASAANVFRSRWQRAQVAAAGMLVEVFIAALAFFGWLVVEPGVTRALLFNVMIVAGVSTLVFNGNPLLRYDAYYILTDLIGMPNLAQRARRLWSGLINRHLFGAHDRALPETSVGEGLWCLAYGLASTAYRALVTVSIALFIATQYFFVGVVLGLWAIASLALWPVWQALQHIAVSPVLAQRRPRAWAVTALLAATAIALLFVVPAPSRSTAEGVVWQPEQGQVRARNNSVVDTVEAAPDSMVHTGQVLLRTHDERLAAQIAQAQARLTELLADHAAQSLTDRAAAGQVQAQIDAQRSALEALQQRDDELTLRAATDGRFVLPKAQDLPGRRVLEGDLLAHVLPSAQAGSPSTAARVRVVVAQDTADEVRHHTHAVALRYAHAPTVTHAARIVREVPAGDENLPSRALATDGGGRLVVDPRDNAHVRTLERTFQFDLARADDDAVGVPAFYGERVLVRFEHAPEPLGMQAWHALRRLFLAQFQL